MPSTYAIKSALILVGAFVLPVAASAATEAVLYNFPNGSEPSGRPVEDDAGNFFGTTYGLSRAGIAYEMRQKSGVWHASTLHTFRNSEGHSPLAGVVQDPSTGIVYGVTYVGGAHGMGTLYKLTRGQKRWNETVLHEFAGSDGSYPVAELRRDAATNVLYGTASQGGSANCGTVFQFDPATSEFKTLYQFTGGSDGCKPTVQLRPGLKDGTLVGATQYGGGHDDGTVYLLTQTSGVWSESVIHRFHGNDGAHPSDLAVSSDGIVFGTALDGGAYGGGVVFRMSPKSKWTYNTLRSFTGSGGTRPVGVNIDQAGTVLYGTTQTGGTSGAGIVYKLTKSSGTWPETVLHNFVGGSADGANPESRPAVDPQTGVLYGVTGFGGNQNGGVFYSVTP